MMRPNQSASCTQHTSNANIQICDKRNPETPVHETRTSKMGSAKAYSNTNHCRSRHSCINQYGRNRGGQRSMRSQSAMRTRDHATRTAMRARTNARDHDHKLTHANAAAFPEGKNKREVCTTQFPVCAPHGCSCQARTPQSNLGVEIVVITYSFRHNSDVKVCSVNTYVISFFA